MSLSDLPDDHGNSMDGALNQESKEPGSKPGTAIDLLCDLRQQSLHSGLQLPFLTGRIGPDKFSTQSPSVLALGGVMQWTKLKTGPPTTTWFLILRFEPASERWCPLVAWSALHSFPEILAKNPYLHRKLLDI